MNQALSVQHRTQLLVQGGSFLQVPLVQVVGPARPLLTHYQNNYYEI